jgi:putative holliday junction resolvase
MDGRVMGLDLGKRRVGVAVSDELGLIAQPLATLSVKSHRDLLAQLEPLVSEYGITDIVVGLPKNLDGSETDYTAAARKIRIALEGHFKIPVHTFDERFTSRIAQRAMHAAGVKLKDNKPALDKISAALLLSDFLRFHDRT